MYPPVPAAFSGSVPDDPDVVSQLLATRLRRTLDLGLSACCLLSGACAWVALSLSGGGPSPAGCVQLVCAAVALPGLLSLWLHEQVQDAPGLAITRLYALVQYRLEAEQGGLAVPRHAPEDPFSSLAGLIAETVSRLRGLQAGRLRARAAAAAVHEALQNGREQAGAVADRMRSDAAAMADAASGIMLASAHLVADAAATRSSSDAARVTIGQVIEQASDVADTVGIFTGHITRLTDAAASAAQAAFSAHKSVAGMVERAAALSDTAEAVSRAMAEARPTLSRADASFIETAVTAMQTTLRELQTELACAVGNMAELSQVVEAQQDVGAELSRAVARQGSAIHDVLLLLTQAHEGLDQLQAGVDGVARYGADRQADAEAIRGAAHRLPAHADVIAGILRNIPDFTQKMDY